MKLSLFNRIIKRTFDILLAAASLTLLIWIIIFAWILSTIFHNKNGFFTQTRIGMYGKKFKIIKIRTMKDMDGEKSTITTSNDKRITSLGRIMRLYKIDEFPQLINVINGSMSFVGPRPDVEGFADKLEGKEKVILSLRPGITGPATLKYRNEEELLSNAKNIKKTNDQIYRNKVKINIEYINNWSLTKDIAYILKTLF